jgi:integrase
MANRDAAGPQDGPQEQPRQSQEVGQAAQEDRAAARRTQLTDLAVRHLKPEAARYEVWDTLLVGFGVRVAPTGRFTWIVRYRATAPGGATIRRREVIGKPWRGIKPATSLKDARDLARVRLDLVGQGVDPVAQDEAATAAAVRAAANRYTIADLGREFLEDGRSLKSHRRPWATKTRAEFARIVNGIVVPQLGELAPEQVTKRRIAQLVDEASRGRLRPKRVGKAAARTTRPAAAAAIASEPVERRAMTMSNRVLDVVRLLYRWGQAHDRVELVPAMPLPLGEKVTRSRILEEGELHALWTALDHEPAAEATRHDPADNRVGFVLSCAFKLLLLTGQRRGEVLRMRWQDLAVEGTGRTARTWWTIPEAFTKNRRRHRVPLSKAAAEVVDQVRDVRTSDTWVFASPHTDAATGAPKGFIANPQKAAERLWKRSGITGARVHDLRRTAASGLTRMKVSRVVVGKILNHAEQGVTGAHYDVYAYDDEKARALDAWARKVHQVVSGREGAAVVPIA